MMTLPKLSAPPGTGTNSNSFSKGFFSTSEWLLQDSRSKFASSSVSPPSSGASGDMSLPKMSSNGFSSSSSGNQADFSGMSRSDQPGAKKTQRSVNAYYKHLDRFKMEKTKSLGNLNRSMRSGRPAILKPLKLWRPTQGQEKMVWVYGNPWSESDPRYLRTGSGQMTKMVERNSRPSTHEMNAYEKYVDDLEIAASSGPSPKTSTLSKSLNSSTEHRVGWASDPTSPPNREMSLGDTTLQLCNMQDFKLLARKKKVGKLKNRRGGKILPMPHLDNISLNDKNAMPNPSSLYSAKSDDLLDLVDSEDNESLIVNLIPPKKIPAKLKKISQRRKKANILSLQEKESDTKEKHKVVNGEDTPDTPDTQDKDTDWYDSEKLNFDEEGHTSTESEETLHRESDIPGMMSVSEPATRSQTDERLEKYDLQENISQENPRMVSAENEEVTLSENSGEANPNHSADVDSDTQNDNNVGENDPSKTESNSSVSACSIATNDESDTEQHGNTAVIVDQNASFNPSNEVLENSAVNEESQNNNKETISESEETDCLQENDCDDSENGDILTGKDSKEKTIDSKNILDSETSSQDLYNQDVTGEKNVDVVEDKDSKDTDFEENNNNVSESEAKMADQRNTNCQDEIVIDAEENGKDEQINEEKEKEEKEPEHEQEEKEHEQEEKEHKQEEKEKEEKEQEEKERVEIKHVEKEYKKKEPAEKEHVETNSEEKLDGEKEQEKKEHEGGKYGVKDEEGNSDDTESSDFDTYEDSDYEDSSPLYSEDKEDVIENDIHLTDASTPEPQADVEVTNPDLLDHFGEKIEGSIESDYDSHSMKNEASMNIDPDVTIDGQVDNNVFTILEHNGAIEHSTDTSDHILPEVTFNGTVDEIVTKLTTKAVIQEQTIEEDLKKADFSAFNWKPDVQFFQFGQAVQTPQTDLIFNFGAGTPPPPQLVKRRPLVKMPRSRSIRRQKSPEKIHKS